MSRRTLRDIVDDIYEIDRSEENKVQEERLRQQAEERRKPLLKRVAHRLTNPKSVGGQEVRRSLASYVLILPAIATLIVMLNLVQLFKNSPLEEVIRQSIPLVAFVVGWLVLSPRLLGKKDRDREDGLS